MLISAGGLPRCLPLHPTAAILTGYLLALNPPRPRRVHISAVRHDSRDDFDDALSHLAETTASETGFQPLAAVPSIAPLKHHAGPGRAGGSSEGRSSPPATKPATRYLLDRTWREGEGPKVTKVQRTYGSGTPIKYHEARAQDASEHSNVLGMEAATKTASEPKSRVAAQQRREKAMEQWASRIPKSNIEDTSDDITRSSREARAQGSMLVATPRLRHGTKKDRVRSHYAADLGSPAHQSNLLDSSWRKHQEGDNLPAALRPSPEFLRKAAGKGKESAWGRGPWDVRSLDLRAQRSRMHDAKREEAGAVNVSAKEEKSTEPDKSQSDSPTLSSSYPSARFQQTARRRVTEGSAPTGVQAYTASDRPQFYRSTMPDPSRTSAMAGSSSKAPLSKIDEQRMKKVEPADELNEQEKAMFERMAREHLRNMPKSPVSAASEDAKTSEGAISILQELFPVELSRKTQATLHKPERIVPRMPMGMPSGKDRISDTAHEEQEEQEVGPRFESTQEVDESLTILVLRKASKHLTENDFHRLIPGGKHIESWTVTGRLLHIIRAREIDTLQPTGDYFIVFSTRAFASRYLEHIIHLHNHSQLHSPSSTSTSRSIPPAPTLANGSKAKFTDPAYTYNLLPPTHELSMRLVDQPFSPLLQRIVADGGYQRLVANRQSPFEVLLWFPTFIHPSFSTIRRCIDEDGKLRGSFWSTVGSDRGIRILQDSASASAPGLPEEQHAARGAFDVDVYGEKRREWKQRQAFGATRFIVSFADVEEANRFVMAWHRRDVTGMMEGVMMESWRSEPIVGQAELIW